MRRPSKTNLFKAFMRLNSISSRKDFLCFGSQMEGAAVTSTFLALRFSFAPGVYFHHLILSIFMVENNKYLSNMTLINYINEFRKVISKLP